MEGVNAKAGTEILHLTFSKMQASILDHGSRQTAAVGGPDVAGAAALSACQAKILKNSLDDAQLALLEIFASGKAAALEFAAMKVPNVGPVPSELADIDILKIDPVTVYMASRNQILLSLVDYRSFAFDIDNGGMQVRLVGNFKGGGVRLLPNELNLHQAELSSHAGVQLGPHTEPPYNCSVQFEGEHSPAPSALILSARWNPLQEPTKFIPVRNAISNLNGLEALALSSKSFCFTRSDCFVKDESQATIANSILQFDVRGDFTLRYSSYRHSLHDEANHSTRQAYQTLRDLLDKEQPYDFLPSPDSALLINNCQALHARDVIKDNRRLLVRLFGYSPDARPVILQQDPLIVRG
ncbi:hypothetical protein O162_08315 [Pseudomonas putida SJ3]|jgi:hypothetical protein|uniref:Uncharacterized protein n=1 Tax=Pseudomonas fortuita TaxID=3233375 RepID=A0ACD4PAW1_9PSED|nr:MULTISPECIES: hypothetical protein [Pseudomonas]ERT18992.1 hypothetical protein O162_08315 [Pseudomonas putida SJ3]WAP64343.1 hypothetical protein OZ911_02725 [Pseudomonas putida]